MKLYSKLLKTSGMKINGIPRYIGINVVFDDLTKISLSDRVVISDECHFLTHDYSLTTALISIGEKPNGDVAFVNSIMIGENVFIGKKCIILPNTNIGKNVIIGAGSVVRGKIPDNSIAIGNPCKVIADIRVKAKKWKTILNNENTKSDMQ